MSVQFNIQGPHAHVTKELSDYAKDKLSKVSHFSDKVTTINIFFTVDRYEHKAEAEIHLAGDQHRIFADAVSRDMRQSIDLLENKLVEQVKKYTEQLHKHQE